MHVFVAHVFVAHVFATQDFGAQALATQAFGTQAIAYLPGWAPLFRAFVHVSNVPRLQVEAGAQFNARKQLRGQGR